MEADWVARFTPSQGRLARSLGQIGASLFQTCPKLRPNRNIWLGKLGHFLHCMRENLTASGSEGPELPELSLAKPRCKNARRSWGGTLARGS